MIQGVNVSTPFMVVNSSALRVLIIGGGPAFAVMPVEEVAVIEFWQGVDGEDVKLGTIGDEALLRLAEASSN